MKRLARFGFAFFKFSFCFRLKGSKCLTRSGDARGRLEQCARGFFKHAEAEKGQWQALARSLARALVILTLIYAIVLIMSLY